MYQKVGQYRLGSLIGEGILTRVYWARDEALQREVALKLLKPAWGDDPQAVETFKQEAKAVIRLNHPHIVAVYEVGEEEGQVYLAQRFVEGESLAARLQRGSLSWEEMLDLLYPLASALDYAHSRGVLHRDIKPANILLDEAGGVYLTDFGLIRAFEGSAGLSTASNGLTGSLPYLAPEVWEGKHLTSATDVYALTCVVVEMLTGRVLFDGSTPAEVRQQHLSQKLEFPAEWVANLPQGAVEIFSWGLARETAHRLKTAGELVTVLAGVTGASSPDLVRSSPVRLAPVVPPRVPPKKQKPASTTPKKRSGLFVAGVTASIVIGIGLTLLACLSLYWFNAGLPVVAQESANPEVTAPVAEEPPATLTPSPAASTSTSAITPTLQPPTATSQPSTARPQPSNPTSQPSPQPTAAEPSPTAPLQARATATAVIVESSPTATAIAAVGLVNETNPPPSPTPSPVSPISPLPTPSPTLAGPGIPEGKGILIYVNKSDYDLIIDVIDPTENTMITSTTVAPGVTQTFILDPGQYTFNSHTPGGKLSFTSDWFEIGVGEWKEFSCC